MLLDLNEQGTVLRTAQQDVDVIGDEAGTVNRIMKTIRNKNLLNKAILLLLAVGLIFADIILLVLKFL